MEENGKYEAELRADLARFGHLRENGSGYLFALGQKVESAIEHCGHEHKRWRSAREKIEAEFESQVGTAVPEDIRRGLLRSVAGHLYDAENVSADLKRRLESVLTDIQAELGKFRT